MAATDEKKRFADAVVSRFGKGVGPAAPPPAAGADDDEADGGDVSDADKEASAMLRKALKSGDDPALCEAIRRIAG